MADTRLVCPMQKVAAHAVAARQCGFATAATLRKKAQENMSLLKEFKEFAVKGNVVDLAVGVVIGASFGKIVTSFVNDVIMPPLGILVGGMDFKGLSLVLREAVEKRPAVTLNYGAFIQNIVDFLIVAAAIFAVVKLINRLKREAPPPPAAPPPPSEEVRLLTEIRDALQQQKQA